jgi:hypothetical protein
VSSSFDPARGPSLLGRLVYQTYFRPRAAVRDALKRGVAASAGDRWHHRQMRLAAARLEPPVVRPEAAPVEIHFLTGRRFWHQTAFCAWSLARTSGFDVAPVLYDDGTLSAADVARVQRALPRTRAVGIAEIEARVDACLPRTRFPHLRARRDVYPNLKKLLDVHAGQSGWKLVLDSDMLFFRRPDQLMAWLAVPDRPCHMVDVETSYGYPMEFLSGQCGQRVAERVNVGATGLRSEATDWDALEAWTREQNVTHGPSYYQEQALIAQLMAGQECAVLAERDYWVLPPDGEIEKPRAVLHHYVASSKPGYYRHGWRNAIQEGGAAP